MGYWGQFDWSEILLAEDRVGVEGSADRAGDRLDEVQWTTEHRLRLRELGKRWGIPKKQLVALNPDLDRRAPIAIGTSVRVYSAEASGVDRSIGFPNKGRLTAAVPMPEGTYWKLRRNRDRAFGTRQTIETLVAVLSEYGETFPGAPSVQLGDISPRTGGLAEPHRSHQTGRDVDLRLVRKLRVFASGRERRVIDFDKTWFIINRLVATGNVQSIYLNAAVQKRLWPIAKAEAGAAEAERIFELLHHAHGHGRHMHVRFRCPDEHHRCIPASRQGS